MLTPPYSYWQVMRWVEAYPRHGAGGQPGSGSRRQSLHRVMAQAPYLPAPYTGHCFEVHAKHLTDGQMPHLPVLAGAPWLSGDFVAMVLSERAPLAPLLILSPE